MAGAQKREQLFHFTNLPDKKCIVLEDSATTDLLMKWSMKDRIVTRYYSYDKLFRSYQKDDFALDFLSDPQVMSTLPVMSSRGSWGGLEKVDFNTYVVTNVATIIYSLLLGCDGTLITTQQNSAEDCRLRSQRWLPRFKAAKVEVEPVSCTFTSMEIFDKLQEEGIVRESGSIIKCLDEYSQDFQISDELRKMLLLEDSDNYEMYSDEERDELLLRLFKHICLGGAVCQYEDDIKPYLDTTKALYKELISVQKDGDTKELRVTSLVYRVKAWDKDNYQFYPSEEDHEQTFAYFIIDPLKRHVAILYHRWGGGVFG